MEKTKKINLPLTFLLLTITIFGLLLLYIVGGLLQIENIKEDKTAQQEKTEQAEKNKFSSYFPGCDILNNNCLSSNCDEYFLCNDKEYFVCEVYDCLDEFGIGTIDEKGAKDVRRKIKVEKEELKKTIEKCRGSIKVISKNCLNDKLEVNSEVVTDGECKIEGFLAIYNSDKPEDKKVEMADILNFENNIYKINLNSCASEFNLIAVGEGGVSIKENEK